MPIVTTLHTSQDYRQRQSNNEIRLSQSFLWQIILRLHTGQSHAMHIRQLKPYPMTMH